MKAYYRPSDLTIVSGVRIWGDEDEKIPHVKAHLDILSQTCKETGCKHVFIDMGSIPSVWHETANVVRDECGYWSPGRARNSGLAKVDTDLVAFTNFDILVTPETVQTTLEAIRERVLFVLQAARWEVPRDITNRIHAETCDPWYERFVIRNLSVPNVGQRPPSGDWQVVHTKKANFIGGFAEDIIADDVCFDFHERMYAMGCEELLTKDIPVLHLYHNNFKEQRDNSELRRKRLMKFVHSGDKKDLDWREA